MTTHILTQWDQKPGKPDTYKAVCGYISHDRAEFIDPTSHSKKPVTCTACLDKTCKKCGEPRYTTPDGYQYQLCMEHLKENFAAIGMIPPRMETT